MPSVRGFGFETTTKGNVSCCSGKQWAAIAEEGGRVFGHQQDCGIEQHTSLSAAHRREVFSFESLSASSDCPSSRSLIIVPWSLLSFVSVSYFCLLSFFLSLITFINAKHQFFFCTGRKSHTFAKAGHEGCSRRSRKSSTTSSRTTQAPPHNCTPTKFSHNTSSDQLLLLTVAHQLLQQNLLQCNIVQIKWKAVKNLDNKPYWPYTSTFMPAGIRSENWGPVKVWLFKMRIPLGNN